MSVKDLPLTNFKIALGECTDRLKVCSSLSILMDDICELEATHGKSLVKLGGQSVLVGGKVEWLPNYSSMWDNSYKSLSSIGGKQHSNLSSSITQNISKKYPDFVKANKKRLATMSSKIAGLIDDLKKAKQVHNKNVEKYLKMVQEAEAALKARVQPGDPSTERTASVAAEEPTSKETTKDNGFMNRSLNKMLSKIAPEKKSQEKVKDLLKEIEVTENSLVLNVQRINNMRQELTAELARGMAEIEELESSRLSLMKEGLSKVCLSVDLLVDKENETSEPIAAQVSKLSPKEELTSCLLKEVDRLAGLSVAAKRKDCEEEGPTASAAENFEVVELMCSAEKLAEAMDYFKQLAVKVTNGLLDISDVERGYSKGATKLLDKHGFTPGGEVSPSTRAGATNSSGCSEALQQLESPLLSAGWQCVVRSFSCIAESHLRTSETLTEEICQKLDSVQKQVDFGRKELQDQWNSAGKRYETAHSSQEKVLVKLSKLQATLKERRNAVRVAKEEQGQGNSATTTSATAAADADLERERDSETEDAPASTAAVSAFTSTVEDKKERKGSMMQGFGDLGTTFRKGGLKQQLGLESPADRIIRIEKQIASLEEEESDLNNALKAAQTNCASVDAAIKAELTAAISTAKNLLSSDLETIKRTFEAFLNWQSEAIGLTKTCAQNMKLRCDEVNVASDLKKFTEVVRTAAQTAAITDTLDTAASIQVLLEIPSMETFEPVKSELIEEERKSGSISGGGGSGGFASVVQSAVKQQKDQQQNGNSIPPLHPPVKESDAGDVSSPLIIDTAPAAAKGSVLSGPPSASSAAGSPVMDSPIRPHTEPPVNPSYEVHSDPAALLSASSTPTTSRKLAEALASPHSPVTAAVDVKDVTTKLFDEPSSNAADVGVISAETAAAPEPPRSPPAITSGELTPSSPSTVPSAAPANGKDGQSGLNSMAAVAAAAMVAQSASKPDKPSDGPVYELAKFGLSPSDKVLESFSCALYPKKGLLTHGRMFITQHYMAFSGWPDTRVLLALSQVRGIEKSNTMGYIPNALTITTDSGEEYFFGSFIDRLPCYQLLVNLSEIAKRIIVIQGPNAPPEVNHSGLELGYQSRSNLFGSLASAAAQFMETEDTGGAPSTAGSAIAGGGSTSTAATPSVSRSLFSGGGGGGASDKVSQTAASPSSPIVKQPSVSTIDPLTLPGPAAASTAAAGGAGGGLSEGNRAAGGSLTPNREALLSPSINYDDIVSHNSTNASVNNSSKSLLSNAASTAETPVVPGAPPNSSVTSVASANGSDKTFKTAVSGRKKAPAAPAPPKVVLSPFSDELKPDGVNLTTFFADKGIALLGEKTFDFSSVDLFKSYFLDGSGYGDFLFSEGDLDIQVGEWKPMSSPLVAEDVSKLSFSHSRPYSYAHPRTTMLMFGPKNAPGTQVQYLYLPHDLTSADTLHTVRPRRGIILNITQFDGIPMADVFKVLQYWTFTCHPSDPSKTVVRVGLAMHYIKSSLFKSQIFGGTKDELSDQLKKWYLFIDRRVSQYRERVREIEDMASRDAFEYGAEEDEEEEAYGAYESQEAAGAGVSGSDLVVDTATAGAPSRRKSFEDASRPMSRRMSRESISKLSTTTASASASYAPAATAASVAVAGAPVAAEPAKDTSKTILVGVLLVFFVLILIQWSYNRSLSRQIAVLNAKFDLSQQKAEEFMRETQTAVERLLRHLNAK